MMRADASVKERLPFIETYINLYLKAQTHGSLHSLPVRRPQGKLSLTKEWQLKNLSWEIQPSGVLEVFVSFTSPFSPCWPATPWEATTSEGCVVSLKSEQGHWCTLRSVSQLRNLKYTYASRGWLCQRKLFFPFIFAKTPSPPDSAWVGTINTFLWLSFSYIPVLKEAPSLHMILLQTQNHIVDLVSAY